MLYGNTQKILRCVVGAWEQWNTNNIAKLYHIFSEPNKWLTDEIHSYIQTDTIHGLLVYGDAVCSRSMGDA